MKTGIHPMFSKSVIICSCGATYETMGTEAEIRVEICRACHPFFSGKERQVDSAGRIEKFKKKYKIA